MEGDKPKHYRKIPLDEIDEEVEAEPQVECQNAEVEEMLRDLFRALKEDTCIFPRATDKNPSLSDDYVFDKEDQTMILEDLKIENFVAKIQDLGKGAKIRIAKGLPQEYLYVFRYACRLYKRESIEGKYDFEKVLLYIKINNRKNPRKVVFVVSFHKNRKR